MRTVGVFSPVVLSILIFLFATLQIRHQLRYGHFFPIGLHADVTFRDCARGRGVTQCIDAHLTNFGLLPGAVEQCKFASDAAVREMGVRYRLERLDEVTDSWQTVLDAEGCRDPRLSDRDVVQPTLQRELWPGQTVRISSEVAPGGDEVDKGTMRFVIESNGRAYPTGAFTILTMRRAR